MDFVSSITNLDLIIDYAERRKIVKEDGDYASFTQKAGEILNKTVFSLDFKNVNMIELMHLMNMGAHTQVNNISYLNDVTEYVGEDVLDAEYLDCLKESKNFFNYIEKDENVNFADIHLPILTTQMDCKASFTGDQIFGILGQDFDSIFKYDEIVEKDDFVPELNRVERCTFNYARFYTKEMIQDEENVSKINVNFMMKFMNNFYKDIETYYKTVDMRGMQILVDRFGYNSEDSIVLTEVAGPFDVSMKFVTDQPVDYTNAIKQLKEITKDHKFDKDIKFFIRGRSSFDAFFYLLINGFKVKPFNLLNDLWFSNTFNIEDKLFTNYQARMQKFFTNLITTRDCYVVDKSIAVLLKILLCIKSTYVDYYMELDLTTLRELVENSKDSSYIKKIMMIEEETTTSKEIKDIIDEIVNTTKLILSFTE